MQADFDSAVLALSGLKHYYALTEASGSTFADSAPSGAVNGTWNGTTCAGGATGPDGVAVVAANDGSTSRYGVTDSALDLTDSNKWTFLAWVKLTTATDGDKMAFELAKPALDGPYVQLSPDAGSWIGSTKSYATAYDGAAAGATAIHWTRTVGSWQMVMVTVDFTAANNSEVIAHNNKALASGSTQYASNTNQGSGNTLGSAGKLGVLNRGVGTHALGLNGAVCGLGIFNRVLSTTERDALYDAMFVPKTASDTASVSDSAAVAMSVAVSASDTIGMSDSATAAVQLGVGSVVTDPMTDPDGTELASHPPSSGSWAAYYTPTTSRLKITSNKLYAGRGDSAPVTAEYQHSASFVDGAIEADVITIGSMGYALLKLRHTGSSGSDTCYRVILDNGGNGSAGYLTLQKVVAGAATTIGTPVNLGSLSGTYRVRLEAMGSAIAVYVNGVSQIAVTDTAVTATGQTSVHLNSPNGSTAATGLHIDDVSIYIGVTYADTVTFTEGSPSVTDPSTAAVSAGDTVTVADARTSLVNAFGGTPGAFITRAPYAAAVSVIAGGTVGTKYAHRAFATGVLADDGNLLVAYRRGTREASVDGSVCLVVGTPDGSGGFTFGSEQTVIDGTLTDSIFSGTTAVSPLPNGYRPAVRDVHIRKFASGRIGLQFTQQRSGTIETSAGVYNPSFLSGAYWCTWFIYSDDDGATWSTPVEVTFTGGSAPTFTYGCFGDDLLELADGTLLVSCYALNAAATSFTAYLAQSTDDGATWSYLSQISSTISGYNAVETSLAQLPDGTVLASFHTEDGLPTDMYLKRSTDGGATWGSATLIAAGESSNRNAILLTPDGDLIHSYAHAVTGFPQGYTVSQDQGVTWSSWTQIDIASAHGITGGADWIHPVTIGAAGASPNLAFVYAWEMSGQSGASIFMRTYTAGAAPGYGTEAVTVSESATVSGTSTTAKTASDAFTVTDTAGVPYTFSSIAATEAVTVADAASRASVDSSTASESVVFTESLVQVFEVEGTSFTIHPQGMVPGTSIGAYLRWEWRGPVAAKLNAGPGAVVRTTTVGDDLTATFAALDPGEYVAYSADYPTRRLFFMVTE